MKAEMYMIIFSGIMIAFSVCCILVYGSSGIHWVALTIHPILIVVNIVSMKLFKD